MRRKLTAARSRAFALIASLGALSALSLLAVTFVLLSRIDQQASANYLDTVRAGVLAEAGLERALAQLPSRVGIKSWEALTETWACTDLPGTRLADLKHPSFQGPGDAYGRAYSTSMGGAYEKRGDTSTLRIVDLASRIYVNGRQPYLPEMLDNLGAAIELEGLGRNPCPPGTGARIVATRALRPGGVFIDLAEVAKVIGAAPWEILRPYVTGQAWVDNSVVQPKPQAELRRWVRGPLPEDLLFQTAVQATGAGRAPVNVNTASVPVLIAVLAGLQGRLLEQESPDAATQFHYRRGTTRAISLPGAQIIARELARVRKATPFKNWGEFRAWVDGFLPPGAGELRNLDAELIKSMANPNALFNFCNPDRVVTNWIQKADLTYFTTELCFSSMGYFEVESLGRVTAQGGAVRAVRQVRALLKVYDVLRHTTQADFVATASPGAASRAPRVRSFPENLNDYAVPSPLDGRLCVRETDPTGGVFRATYDETLLGSDRFLRKDFFAFADCREDGSVFARTNTQASDLFPDGVYHSSLRGKITHYSTLNNVNPLHCTLEFWVKPSRLTASVAWLPLTGRVEIVQTPATGYDLVLTAQRRFRGGPLLLACTAFRFGWTVGYGIFPGARFQVDLPPWIGKDAYAQGIAANLGDRLAWGLWHHVAICWYDGASARVYIDGEKLIDMIGAPAPNGMRPYNFACDELSPACNYLPATLTQWPPGLPLASIGIGDMTHDGIRIDKVCRYTGSFRPPNRYPRSLGGVAHVGEFAFPAGGSPRVHVLSLSCTSYRPAVDGRGQALPEATRPEVRMEWEDPATAKWSSEFTDNGVCVNLWVDRRKPLRYRAKWYDNGLTPNNASAWLDDVTLCYADGAPRVLAYMEDPN
ncbi:MAG: hypothetical protein HZA54_14255 [Planctomycetes bacterium]|nr:hypothetical protein [Planctomycetota bacterium]